RNLVQLPLVAGFLVGGSGALAQYCLPTYTSQCTSNDFINGVVIDDGVTTLLSNTGTGCSSPSANNYVDYTGTISAFQVAPGNTYNVTLSPGASWGQYFILGIDFNADQDFADPGEFFNIGYAAANGSISGTFTIPVSASGPTVL